MTEGREIEVTEVKAITGTPAASLAVAGWLAAQASGYGDDTLDLDPSLKGFVACLKEGIELNAVGVVTWIYDEETRRFVIKHGFVLEEHRGCGVFTALMNHTVAKAMNLGAVAIDIAVNAKNRPARSVATKLGFSERAVILSHEV